MCEHANFAALRICVFGFLLIKISSRKAVPEVTSTFPGPLHEQGVRAASHVKLVVAELCRGTPAERWELAGKTAKLNEKVAGRSKLVAR